MGRDRTETLGELVSRLRKAEGLTQEELGRAAGYRTGAGVAISRLESGQVTPRPDRLDRIAKALNVDTATLESSVPAKAAAGRGLDGHSSESLEARRAQIHAAVAHRKSQVAKLSDALYRAREQSVEKFLDEFSDVATRVGGLALADASPSLARPVVMAPGEEALKVITASPPDLMSQWQVPAFTSMLVARPWANSGASMLSRSSQALALTALATAPIVALGLFELNKRTRTYQRELAEQLEQAEGELAASQPGIDAFASHSARATDLFNYIAIHAGHALTRWSTQLVASFGDGDTVTQELTPEDQQRLSDFGVIAAAHMAVANLGLERLLATREIDVLEEIIAQVDETLSAAEVAVEAIV